MTCGYPGLYFDINQGIHCIKIQSTSSKWKYLFGLSYSKNMANFEAFLQSISFSTNSEIVRCEIWKAKMFLTNWKLSSFSSQDEKYHFIDRDIKEILLQRDFILPVAESAAEKPIFEVSKNAIVIGISGRNIILYNTA